MTTFGTDGTAAEWLASAVALIEAPARSVSAVDRHDGFVSSTIVGDLHQSHTKRPGEIALAALDRDGVVGIISAIDEATL